LAECNSSPLCKRHDVTRRLAQSIRGKVVLISNHDIEKREIEVPPNSRMPPCCKGPMVVCSHLGINLEKSRIWLPVVYSNYTNFVSPTATDGILHLLRQTFKKNTVKTAGRSRISPFGLGEKRQREDYVPVPI